MRRFAELFLAAVDVLSAESKEVGRVGVRAARSSALALGFTIVLIAGVGFVLAATYLALAGPLGPPAAALITGLVGLGTGLIGLWSTRWRTTQ